MTINKNGWLFTLAYWPNNDDSDIKQGNLCRFFWRLVFQVFVFFPIICPIIGTVAGAFFIIYCIVGFLFGLKPDLNGTYPYKKWLTIKGYPFMPILPIGIILFLLAHTNTIVLPYAKIWTATTHLLIYGLCWVVAVIFICSITDVFDISGRLKKTKERMEGNELYRVIKGYIMAKKQRVCPIIFFVDESELKQS